MSITNGAHSLFRVGTAIAVLSTCALILSPRTIAAFSTGHYVPTHASFFRASRCPTTTTSLFSSLQSEDTFQQISKRLSIELNEVAECARILISYVSKSDKEVTVKDVVLACDAVDGRVSHDRSAEDGSYLDRILSLRQKFHEFGRYHLLVKLLQSDYDAYIKTAEFLSPSRISRSELPNVQEVKYVVSENIDEETKSTATKDLVEDGVPLVLDCELESMSYNDSPLDVFLLSIFRNLVTQHTGGVRSDIGGIKGLLAQGREYMTMELPEGVSYQEHAIAQHTMVKNTLGGLMTPALPPFYRIFMSGIVPNLGTEWDGKQIGPWFYAPWLTSVVTPPFFGFLVGPSKPNRRLDGKRGGLIVEKCKFLQESGCKGLCLHQCKIPAQEFFRDKLGMELTVRPNFVTQECQWSFGEKPIAPEEDPAFPLGCLVGCESRKLMAGRKSDKLCM